MQLSYEQAYTIGQDNGVSSAVVQKIAEAIRPQADVRPGDGTVLVPRVLTQHMDEAMDRALKLGSNQHLWDEVIAAAPPAESAAVGLPAEALEWHKARQAYIEAVGIYNARVAFARETERQDPKLFGTIKVDTEWHLMNEAQNKMGALLEPMGKALDAYFARTHEAVHTDDAAVDRFAVAMKGKLAHARNKGRGGWEQCDPVELSIMLREHVEKGDPIDVANFCMFLWNLGKPISDAALPYGKRASQQQADPKRCEYCDGTGDVHRADGEWLGECTVCKEAQQQPQRRPDPTGLIARLRIHGEDRGNTAFARSTMREAAGILEDQQEAQPSADADIACSSCGLTMADSKALAAMKQAELGADERSAFEASGLYPGLMIDARSGFSMGYRAAQAGQQARVAEGWKLVPIHPTKAMLDAIAKAVSDGFVDGMVWMNAIDAAPTQQEGTQ